MVELDAALRDHLETTHYYDEETPGQLYAPDPPPEVPGWGEDGDEPGPGEGHDDLRRSTMNDEPSPTPEPETAPEPEGRDPNAEAAKYRRRLRETEAQRDELASRLDATHRALVEQQAADLFADPADLWHATSIDDLRGDDGLIDPERATSEIERVLTAKPHWRKEPARPNRSPGSRRFTKGRGSPSSRSRRRSVTSSRSRFGVVADGRQGVQHRRLRPERPERPSNGTSWADRTVPTPVPRAPLAASTRGGGGSRAATPP